MAEYEISALGDKVLRTLWYMSEGSPRLLNVKALLSALGQQEPSLDRDRLAAELEILSENGLVEARRARVGIIMAKLKPEGVTYIHSNQPGIPLFYTRNIDALSVDELKSFLNELHGRLAGSDVGGRDFNLTKEKLDQVKYALSDRASSTTKRIAIWSIVIALLAALGTITQALLSTLL
jgi:hypothetical protein